MYGPIDFVILGFESNDFDGRILESLEKPIREGVIRLLGLAVVSKDWNGNVTEIEASELQDRIYLHFEEHHLEEDYVDQDDIDEVGALLEPGTAAGVLFIEHIWAKPLKRAILDKGGILIAEGRIHPDAAAELD